MKGAVYKLKEMGEDGRGSLEPGVASGDEFIMAYPHPFLEYYYAANRSELPDAVCATVFGADAVVGDGAAAVGGGADDETAGGDGTPAAVKQEKEVVRAPIFDLFEEASSTLATAGPQRGKYTIKYKCCVMTPTGLCGGVATCYKRELCERHSSPGATVYGQRELFVNDVPNRWV